MKKFFLQRLPVLFMGLFSLQVSAQTTRTAILTGDTCAGSTLTATLSSGGINEVTWYKDSVIIDARTKYDPNSTIVAGGSSDGTSLGQLNGPIGIYMYKGSLFIIDLQRVTRWVPGASSGVLVAGGNGKGTALNQFYAPTDIVVDKDGYLYITDYLTYSVRKWKQGATSGVIVAGGNGYGAAANQLAGPQSICIDRFGNLYISDRWNHRVQKWAPGATTGVTVAGGNGRGSAANQLYEPTGVGIDYAGNVYVSDFYNYRVQKWAPGATTGVTVAGGNGNGINANQLSGPGDLSVDSAGAVYVLDGGSRVQKWSPGSTHGVTVAGGNTFPSSPTDMSKLISTQGIYVDPYGQVYVSEVLNNRVRKFKTAQITDSKIVDAKPGTYKAVITPATGAPLTSNPLRVTAIPDYPAQVGGPNDVVKHSTIKFSVKNPFPGALYTWTVPYDAQIIAGQGTPNLTVKWGMNVGEVGVTASNSCGSSKTRIKYITSACTSDDVPPFPAQVGGPNIVNKQSPARYDVKNPPEGTHYLWTVPAGVNIVSGQNTPVLNVIWGDQSGPITVTAYNGCFGSQTRTKNITVSSTLMILSQDNGPTATVYPNPTASGAAVAFTSEKTSAYELTVTNMSGKPLLKQKGTAQAGKNTTNLNIGGFDRGVYLVNIKYDDNTTQVLKITKQ